MDRHRILFVCAGNICRSPLAEGIFRHLAAEAGRDSEFQIDSAGTGGWVIINQIGAILYLQIDVLVANRMFGPEQSGSYAAMLQLPYLIRLLGTTIAAV